MIALSSVNKMTLEDRTELWHWINSYQKNDFFKTRKQETEDKGLAFDHVYTLLQPVRTEIVTALFKLTEDNRETIAKIDCECEYDNVILVALDNLRFLNLEHFCQFLADMTVSQVTVMAAKVVTADAE